MSINGGFLYLTKWELLEVLCTVNSYLFVFGKPKGFLKVLKRIHKDKELNPLERSLVMADLRASVDGQFYDYFLTNY
jgi:hypothetical protein